MKFRFYSLIILLCIVTSLVGYDHVYADEFYFDQQSPFIPDHSIRLIFESSEPMGSSITATLVSKNSSGGEVETKTFALTQIENTFYRSNYIKLVKTTSSTDQIKVVNDGTLDVTINGQTTPGFKIISSSGEDVNLKQLGYKNKYNIGSLVDCSGSFYGGDTDGDGICDNWENQSLFASGEKGLHITKEGSNEIYYLPCDPNANIIPESQNYDPLGITVCPSHDKADIYFEIDWMYNHSPNPDSLAEIVQSFSNSPFDETGIVSHFQLSDGILPHDKQVTSPGGGRNPGTDSLKLVWFGTEAERAEYGAPSIPSPSSYWTSTERSQKAQVFHYVIFGHDRSGAVGTSGYSEMPGNDILITLGSWEHSVGTQDQQSGTLMHEIGHNLNLHHGGMDAFNCKPNYISVMSYSRQTGEFINDRPLDFSQHKLLDLTEPQTSIIGSYGGNELETVYGDESGNPTIIMTGDNSEISGNFNNIPDANCDGTGSTLSSQTDWDPEILSLVARTHSNWVDGVDIDRNPKPSVIMIPEGTPDEMCQKIPEVARGASKSWLFRYCPVETLQFDNIKNFRGGIAEENAIRVSAYVPSSYDPSSGGEEPCALKAARLLEELATNDEISPAEAKEILEDLMNKFDGSGNDDCDIPSEDKKEIFDSILFLYERYAAAVPEFETMVLMILSISILSVVVLTRKTKIGIFKVNY